MKKGISYISAIVLPMALILASFTKNSTKSYEPEMVSVEGGSFAMGNKNKDEYDAKPVHQVTLSSFKMSKYEITNAQWKAVMGNNPSVNKDCDNCPVDNVKWNEVQDYLKKLDSLTGKHYRLPTEAEWEFAASSGKKTHGYVYAGGDDINTVAWYAKNSNHTTHPVGTKQPNELGIYDMTGNVVEWCNDRYAEYDAKSQEIDIYNYIPNIPRVNAQGLAIGEGHVMRGGSWAQRPEYSRVTTRGDDCAAWHGNFGFRVVLSPSSF